MKTVQRISKAKFKISTPNVPNSELLLDFNPVIDEFKLVGNFYLIHWQARPKGYREWGIYSSRDDTYTSTELPNQKAMGSCRLLMLDDPANTIPSAVIAFYGYLKLQREV